MKDNGKKEVTVLKSYLEFEEDDHKRMCYSIADVRNGRCEFVFQIAAAGKYKWHLNTDFSIKAEHICCTGEKTIPVVVENSEDMREVIAGFETAEPGRITVSCSVEALDEKESLKTIKREYSNRVAHIELLLQRERELKSECLMLQEKENRYLSETEGLHSQIANLNCQIADLHRQAEVLRNSRTYRFGSVFTRFIRFFFPKGKKRTTLVRILATTIKHPGRALKDISGKSILKALRLLSRGDLEEFRQLLNKKVYGIEEIPQLQMMPPAITAIDSGDEKNSANDYPELTVPQTQNPQVSIIIPVYNQFEYTYLCIKSILLNSGNVPYEIIVADDCSTDLTTQIEQIIVGVRVVRTKKNLRFLRNCNHAAKQARGQYILFLNNDTQVQPDWLEPLVDLIGSDAGIGMVGSKLIYPDGRLQEAGGILWRDGSAWNYGNGQNPALPEFNYVKEVDYISGASIMIRRELWESIGGFDERFAPAYCEDSDLAFAVRKAGYKVLYQPRSVVVHFEGISNGTDLTSGQKAYQVVNQKKFLEKWKAELAEHPENGVNVFQARDRSYIKKTVLIIDHYVPKFDQDAGSRTIFQYTKLFLSQDYNVKFIEYSAPD